MSKGKPVLDVLEQIQVVRNKNLELKKENVRFMEQAIRHEKVHESMLMALKAVTEVLKKVDAIEVHRRGDVIYCPYCQVLEQADAAIAAEEEETDG